MTAASAISGEKPELRERRFLFLYPERVREPFDRTSLQLFRLRPTEISLSAFTCTLNSWSIAPLQLRSIRSEVLRVYIPRR